MNADKWIEVKDESGESVWLSPVDVADIQRRQASCSPDEYLTEEEFWKRVESPNESEVGRKLANGDAE